MAWWQAIIWTNDGLIYWCIYASLSLNELNCQEIDGLMQDCSISSALVMELLQSCAKPSKW